MRIREISSKKPNNGLQMDGRETKGVGSKKIFRGSKFQVEGEKKLKCDFLLNFNINDQTQNFRNVKIGGEKKKPKQTPKSLNLKKKSLFWETFMFVFSLMRSFLKVLVFLSSAESFIASV